MTDTFSQYPISHKPSVNGNARLLHETDPLVLLPELLTKLITISKKSMIYFDVEEVRGGEGSG